MGDLKFYCVDEFDKQVIVYSSQEDEREAYMDIDVDFDDLCGYFYSLYYEKYEANPSKLEWKMYQVSSIVDIIHITEKASKIDAETVWAMIKIFNSCSVDMKAEILFCFADVAAEHKKSNEGNMLAKKLIDSLYSSL